MRTKLQLISAAFVSLLAGCGEAPTDSAPASKMATGSAPMEAKLANQTDEGKSLAPVEVNLTNRQIVRNGQIELRVADIEAAEKKIQDIVKQAGGFVSDSASSNLASENSTVNLTSRVPVARFDDTLTALAELGTVLSKSTSATDVTGQVADMDARLKVMRAQEEVYLRTMHQSNNMKDTISVQDQLMQLRERIEGTEAQLKSQREQAAFSTIKVTIVSATRPMAAAKADNWMVDSFVDSRNGLMVVVSFLGRIAISLAVFAPLWAPVALGAWWWSRRRRRLVPPVITH